jgi:FtsZ-interacting cell division protein ZipA
MGKIITFLIILVAIAIVVFVIASLFSSKKKDNLCGNCSNCKANCANKNDDKKEDDK